MFCFTVIHHDNLFFLYSVIFLFYIYGTCISFMFLVFDYIIVCGIGPGAICFHIYVVLQYCIYRGHDNKTLTYLLTYLLTIPTDCEIFVLIAYASNDC